MARRFYRYHGRNVRGAIQLFFFLATMLLSCRQTGHPPRPGAEFVDSRQCADCHPDAARGYAQTGMARAFSRFGFDKTAAVFAGGNNEFHHAPSKRTYRMLRRGDHAYMRRWQADPHGGEANVVELRIDYILGSGHKAQTFLHRTESGELLQLPVTWYRDHWAMSPSYDRPDHEDFRRRIRFDCFFCHNAYPAVAGGGSFYGDAIYPNELPMGIDCQRCHGPGSLHVSTAAATAAGGDAIRQTIVNPARMTRDAAMEVCMQCHLQSSSRALPYAVQKLNRGVFTYRAGEPLADYVNHFDQARPDGRRFEIAHAAYRLRQSRCYTESTTLGCITCHSPHHDAGRSKPLKAVCAGCHNKALPAEHTRSDDCASCHMPQRRTQDVVHVVMTDHRIQRRALPAQDANTLTAPRAELPETADNAYRGPVAPYYPATAPDPLLEAIAQVRAGSNHTAATVVRLEQLAANHPEAWYELGEAHWRASNRDAAFAAHQTALRLAPAFLPSLRSLGMQRSTAGDLQRGAELLEQARAIQPADARTLHDLGVNYFRQGKQDLAIRTLRQAVAADPLAPESQNALGAALAESGDRAAAEIAFREALRAEPNYTQARENLEKLRP